MAIKSVHNIRHSGILFPAGTVITDDDMDAKSQKRLVDGGVAQYVTSVTEAKKSDKITVKELEAKVAIITDIAELEKLLEGEDRKGAIEVINKRIDELIEAKIEETAKIVSEMTDVQELEKLLADENWESVHEVIQNRIKELKENV